MMGAVLSRPLINIHTANRVYSHLVTALRTFHHSKV